MASHLNEYIDVEYLKLYLRYLSRLDGKISPQRLWSQLTEELPLTYYTPRQLLLTIGRKLKGDPDYIEDGFLPLVNKLVIILHGMNDDETQNERLEEIWFETRGIAAELKNTLQSTYPKKNRDFFRAILELGKQLEILAPWINLGTAPVLVRGVGEWLLN